MLTFLLLVAGSLAARISYEGQQILRCQEQRDIVTKLWDANIDVQGVVDGFVDVRVQSSTERDFVQSLTTCEVAVPDLEAATQEFEASRLAVRNNAAADWFDDYHTYDEISAWYQKLAGDNPSFVSWEPRIGATANNRSLFAIRIYDKNNGRNPQYRVFWTGQIHAREWIAGATVQYLVNQTLEGARSRESVVMSILNKTEIVVVPIINPDGYVYSWTTDRQWRKNRRSPPTGSTCFGVDENRNFNSNWGQGGSSTNPCSDTYMGQSAASELEVRAVSNYYMDVQSGSGVPGGGAPIIGAIDWHSYSQLVLRPYGNNGSDSPDEAELKKIGDKYSADVRASSGLNYTSQKSFQLYVTTGTASDWYYSDEAYKGNKGYRCASYTVELRPLNNPPGFLLPPAQIVPCGKENWAAIKNWLDYLTKSPILRP